MRHATPVRTAAALTAALTLALGGAVAAEAHGRQQPDPAAGRDPGLDRGLALQEARRLLAAEGLFGRALARETADRKSRFTDEENVFLASTIALKNLEDPNDASAVVPLFRGIDGDGEPVEYIITETSDFRVAQLMGINYSPKLVWGRGSGGDQEVTLNRRGEMVFPGTVDFSPELSYTANSGSTLVPGTEIFPPAAVQPGAVADDEWSSLVVLPSGLVLNVGQMANGTGIHDRVVDIDVAEREVEVELLDGFQGGDQLYYHFVTDASDPVAAALEEGVYSPRLALLPGEGQTTLDEPSPRLAFSPNINGVEDLGLDRQGLNTILSSGGLDPINVFPIDPDNDARRDNNYSPMWDAHVNQWTQEAVDAGERRRIRGLEDLTALVDAGLVESGVISPDGPGTPFVAGLRPTGIIINCPVIAQPFEGSGRDF
jgi:hypothetical protein